MDIASDRKSILQSEKQWSSLYKVGAIAAFVYVAMMLVPLVLMIAAPIPPVEGGAAILD